MGMSAPEWSRFLHDEAGVPDDPGRRSTATSSSGCSRRTGASCRCCRARRKRCGGRLRRSRSRSRPPRTAQVFEEVLELAGLADCFRATVSSEEVARGKPAPDVYLEAARRLERRAGALHRGRGLPRRHPLGEVGRDARRRDPERGLPAGRGGARPRRRRRPLARRADVDVLTAETYPAGSCYRTGPGNPITETWPQRTVALTLAGEAPEIRPRACTGRVAGYSRTERHDPLQDLLAARVEGADARRQRVEVLAEHREDRDVAQRPALARPADAAAALPPRRSRACAGRRSSPRCAARSGSRSGPPRRPRSPRASARPSTRSRSPAASRSRAPSSRSRARPARRADEARCRRAARVSSAEKIPYVKFSPASKLERKDSTSSIFCSSVCGSSSAHGIHGCRCSRLESIASFSSGASRGS